MPQDELNKTKVPDPQVVPQAKRRRFSAEYKLRILEEVDACTEPGQVGALLRRWRWRALSVFSVISSTDFFLLTGRIPPVGCTLC